MFGEPSGKTIERTIKCSVRIFGALCVGLEWSPFVVLISVTQRIYTPQNSHDIGTSPFSIGNSSSNGGVSIVMIFFFWGGG